MIVTLAGILSKTKDNQMLVLYVDGNSPDGTADIIKKFQKKYSWLHLLVETKKEGLGMAYAKGMQYAMKELKDVELKIIGYLQKVEEFKHYAEKNNLNNIIPIIPKININFVSIITSTNAIILKRAINLLTYII